MRLGPLRWPTAGPAIPIEEIAQAGRYVIRAELPGLDPSSEITVMVADNEATIEARRPVRLPSGVDCDFHHEPVRRTVRLPPGARDDTLRATYDDRGILCLTVELARPVVIGRLVRVDRTAGP
jgi:HSP20 family molecular chaperone IbpA